MEERRRFPRHRTLKGGQIHFNGHSVECLIRDLSEGGAGLRVANTRGIPSEIDLTFDDGHTALGSFVKWRSDFALGVEFPKVRPGRLAQSPGPTDEKFKNPDRQDDD